MNARIGNIVILNNEYFRTHQTPETVDSIYESLVSEEEHLKKVWSHVCPGIGLVVQMEAVCDRCLKTKPEIGKE